MSINEEEIRKENRQGFEAFWAEHVADVILLYGEVGAKTIRSLAQVAYTSGSLDCMKMVQKKLIGITQ